MVADVKSEQVTSQHPLQQLSSPGTDPKDLGGRPGRVPEMRHAQIRSRLLQEPRQEREMKILGPDEGAPLSGFL